MQVDFFRWSNPFNLWNFVLCNIWIMAPAFCTGVVASSIIFGIFFLPTSQQEKSVNFNLLAYWWQTVHIGFPSDICSPSNALDLLGSPVWGSNDIYDSHFATKVDQTLLLHSLLNYLDWKILAPFLLTFWFRGLGFLFSVCTALLPLWQVTIALSL